MISKSSPVMFDMFVCFVLLAISEEPKTFFPFFFFQCVIKQLLDSVFVITRIMKSYQPQPFALAVNPYLSLDCSGYNKNPIQ